MNIKSLLILTGKILLGLTLALVWLLFLSGPPRLSRAASLTVCQTGPPDCDYSTIQAAIDAANDGDIIKVAQGQYTSVASQVVYINKSITLAGGYSVTNWDNADPLYQLTVIDAEGEDRRGVYIDGTNVSTITLTGLTVQNAAPLNLLDGAGIFIQNGTVILRDNVVTNNTTDLNGTKGGGLFVNSGTVSLIGNTFQNNNAAGGGGVGIENGILLMKSNRFVSNGAFFGGGLFTDGTVTMSSNVFLGNYGGPDQGPSIYINRGTVDAENDIIADSGDNPAGEAVFLDEGTLTARHWTLANNGSYAIKTNGRSAVLTNTIVASHALGGLSGAGIVADTTLFSNSGTPCSGGAICTNSLSGAPEFVNPAEGDYHISPGSAAIDVGVDAGVVDDIDGDRRPIGAGYDIGADELGLPVDIDIKPGSYPNSINLKSMGLVPVAILTTEVFDATTVDPISVVFTGEYPLRWAVEDIDDDGDMDLIIHFKTQELNLDGNSIDAMLEGETFSGLSFFGVDTLKIKQ